MPQMAWFFSTAHVIHRERNLEMKSRGKRIEKFRKKFSDSKKVARTGGNSRAWITSGENQPVQAGVIERGTAAQGVPVRQKRVAELDDDVAVLSSGKLEETKRDWRLQHL